MSAVAGDPEIAGVSQRHYRCPRRLLGRASAQKRDSPSPSHALPSHRAADALRSSALTGDRRRGGGNLGHVAAQRKYWSERQGRGPKAEPLEFERLREFVIAVFDDFFDRDYFVEAFGKLCVDGNDSYGTVGRSPEAWFLRKLGRQNIWPYTKHWETFDADALFDLAEVLSDLVSKPLDGWMHSFAGCGMHWNTFERDEGFKEFRNGLNSLLELYDPPLELSRTGEVVSLVPSDLQPLLDAPLPASADADLVTERVDTAVALFRSRNSTKADRRQAVRELADALEAIRSEVKEEMLPKDERELFHLANGFAIRHNNREQRNDYDDAIWLSWAFYVYLATIHAVLRLKERESAHPTASV
jgi:hypothetical protein